jgi:hypothetical protein
MHAVVGGLFMSERRLPDDAEARLRRARAAELERARIHLATALTEANTSPKDTVAQVLLHDVLCEFVPLLQKQGFDAERALIECETVIAGVWQPNNELFGRDALVQRTLSFCIDQYYHGGAGKEWR